MQCSVTIVVEIAPEAGIAQMEQAIEEAGRQAMRVALGQVVRSYEAAHAACPRCGSLRSQNQGTGARRVLTRFGRVVLRLRRQWCATCRRRFRPARDCLGPLHGGNVTPSLGAACALAGASWPYATAARVLHELSGAQVSHEEVRRWTRRLGQQAMEEEEQAAERLLTPTAEQVRGERDAQARLARRHHPGSVGTSTAGPLPVVPPTARLVVGLDGGWVPSRDQVGGMEGKVAVVATGVQAVGRRGRQRLSPRRYVATFGSAEQVGTLAYAAAVGLDGQDAREQIVLGDGATWIKTQAAWHFPDAVGILDWAHVSRALHKAIRAARPGTTNRALRRQLHQALPDALWHGDLEATLAALHALRPAAPGESPPALEAAITYLQGQRTWLGNYAAWQDAGYPVGSGLIERAVALVINRRMKRQGMRWRRDTASEVVALRGRQLNADWDANDDHLPSPRAA